VRTPVFFPVLLVRLVVSSFPGVVLLVAVVKVLFAGSLQLLHPLECERAAEGSGLLTRERGSVMPAG
jgi:hypothetical protein